jgi:hypothetical protein
MKLGKLDRIELSMADIDKISKWYEFHYDELKEKGEFNFPLEECLIVVQDDFIKGSGHEQKFKDNNLDIPYNEIMVHFKIENDFDIRFDLYIQEQGKLDDNPTLSWKLNNEYANTGKFTWTSGLNKINIPEELAQGQARFQTRVAIETFAYMVNVSENVIEKKQTRVYNKKASAKKGGKNKKRQVKISVNKYTFDHERSDSGRKYDRHTDGWTVRGHWRYYKKSGKRVWIPSYSKGDKRNVEEKTYKF